MALAPGDMLGPYEILGRIGAGGMGEVYRATDTRLHRVVAIKVPLFDKVANPERKRRFLQEARAASALNHPNIVTLHDIANHGGLDFLVMEYGADEFPQVKTDAALFGIAETQNLTIPAGSLGAYPGRPWGRSNLILAMVIVGSTAQTSPHLPGKAPAPPHTTEPSSSPA